LSSTQLSAYMKFKCGCLVCNVVWYLWT
jgi:hypothetical protein